MRSFTIIQNFLTAIVIPFLALIVGVCSFPGIYIFFKIIGLFGTSIDSFNEIDSVPLEDLVITGVALGMGITAWGGDSGDFLWAIGRAISAEAEGWKISTEVFCNNPVGLVHDFSQNSSFLLALSSSVIHWKYFLSTIRCKVRERSTDQFSAFK